MSKTILSVEDDDAAYRLLEVAFQDLKLDVDLYRAMDGEDGLRFLRKQGVYWNAPSPDLMLLNLNMPRMGGLEVLSVMKSDPALIDVPAVVFSSSNLDADKAECLALGAKHFITKPSDFDNLLEAVTTACQYATGARSAAGGVLFPD